MHTNILTACTELVGHGTIFDEETAGWLRSRANKYGNGGKEVKLLQPVALDADNFAVLHGLVQHCDASIYS